MPPKKTIGDQNFTKVMNELRKLHKEYPALRFGALVQMAMDLKKKRENYNLNDVSSKELLVSLGEFRENQKKLYKKGG